MKEIAELKILVVDYGSFIGLADALGPVVRECHYHSPCEEEYQDITKCCIGDGFENFERCDDFMDPDFLKDLDLAIFPDIGFRGHQRYLRSIGKLVWGSMGASDLELYRTRFLKVLHDVGLPMVKSVKIVGLTALAEHLKQVDDRWIKVNRFRANMETWHHIDYDHSQRDLERLACAFGGMKEHIVFVVQEPINKGDDDEPVLEIGYDGICVDGQFPDQTFQGYELKNQLYLGSLLAYKDLPEEVQFVNEKFGSVLKEWGYRNFLATEIRVKGGVPYFIDPTCRCAGQTMEHQFQGCKNLAEVIYRGAAGEVVKPEFDYQFAAEATMHYTAESGDGWKTLRVPAKAEKAVALYHCCCVEGIYQFPPYRNDEVGVICGQGESIEGSIEDLKENFEAMGEEPVRIDSSGFAELLEQINEAESEGLEFSDQPVPEPEVALS